MILWVILGANDIFISSCQFIAASLKVAMDFSYTLFLGLNGKTNLEKAKTDMLCDGLRDIGQHAMAFFRENDEARKVCYLFNHLFLL